MDTITSSYYVAEITLQFTKECLAGGYNDNLARYTFERDTQGNIVFPAKYWRKMLKDAMEAYAPNVLHLLPRIHPDTLRFGRAGIGLVQDSGQYYEALPIDSKLTIEFLVPDVLPLETLSALFGQAGRWLGFSPAKAHYGYGRFRVLTCVAKPTV